MSKTFSKKPLALALGAAFTLTGVGAQASVFQMSELASGYMVAQATPATPATPAKPAEGKKGSAEADAKAACEKMKKEGKCGEGRCGGGACDHKAKDGKDKAKEGKCGEGKCGEGKCGGML